MDSTPTNKTKYVLDKIGNYPKIVLLLIIFTIPINLLSNIKSQAEEKPEFYSKTNIWQKLPSNENSNHSLVWEKYYEDEITEETYSSKETKRLRKYSKFNSFNRSIVFDDYIVGPDISWLVPPGLRWSRSFTVDGSVRGHSRRKKGEDFLGWNGGDAVGQFYYQFKHSDKYSYGLNLGMRSVYEGSGSGGSSPIGEGLSSGFRWDYQLSKNSGFALGGEQIFHFDNLTDTGRDFYFTISKVYQPKKEYKDFPLYILTAGVGTGKMAEGNIKGLCSDLFGGSGTEIAHERPLCWAPVFTVSKVYNESLSTFFEYNSKWFLLGTSFAPLNNIPLRGTFAVQLSDHIENYQINDFDDLKWNFRLSLGF